MKQLPGPGFGGLRTGGAVNNTSSLFTNTTRNKGPIGMRSQQGNVLLSEDRRNKKKQTFFDPGHRASKPSFSTNRSSGALGAPSAPGSRGILSTKLTAAPNSARKNSIREKNINTKTGLFSTASSSSTRHVPSAGNAGYIPRSHRG
ncbi:unnamed protein product [Amoebophrya sp. A120]|nr:unnamed protein product [Amoebophrya sp. A120]|eukprot:GSA120T00026179001.1